MEFWEETRVTPPKRVSHSLTRRTTLGTLSFNYWHNGLLTNVTHICTNVFSFVYADWSRWLTLTPESTSPSTVAPTLVLPLESIVASHWNVSWKWHRNLSWDQALSSITTQQRSLCQNCCFGKLPKPLLLAKSMFVIHLKLLSCGTQFFMNTESTKRIKNLSSGTGVTLATHPRKPCKNWQK